MKTKISLITILVLLLSMPFALAVENETTEIKGGKQYPAFERAVDRILYIFTLQIERKAALIEKIEQRRQEHYQFLIANGKTEQAARFNATTTGLVRNFDQWKANKQDILVRMENKSMNRTRDVNETDREKRNQTEPRGPKINKTRDVNETDDDDENETEDDD